MQFFCIRVVPKRMNFATFSRDLVATSKLLSSFRPAFWWRDLTTQLVFS